MGQLLHTCLRAGLKAVTQSDPIHPAPHRSRKIAVLAAAISGIFLVMLEPIEAKSVSYRGTAPRGKIRASIRFPHSIPETFE
jgi:hypothetical protein